MCRVLVGVLGALALAWPAAAQVTPFPGDFRTQEITTDDGATLHIRAGGQGLALATTTSPRCGLASGRSSMASGMSGRASTSTIVTTRLIIEFHGDIGVMHQGLMQKGDQDGIAPDRFGALEVLRRGFPAQLGEPFDPVRVE